MAARGKVAATVTKLGKRHGGGGNADTLFEALLTIAKIIDSRLAHIEKRIDIMAVNDQKFSDDLTAIASDLDEIKAGIASLVSGMDSEAQAEADKLTASLDTAAAAIRDTASQFDAPAPSPTSKKK